MVHALTVLIYRVINTLGKFGELSRSSVYSQLRIEQLSSTLTLLSRVCFINTLVSRFAAEFRSPERCTSRSISCLYFICIYTSWNIFGFHWVSKFIKYSDFWYNAAASYRFEQDKIFSQLQLWDLLFNGENGNNLSYTGIWNY